MRSGFLACWVAMVALVGIAAGPGVGVALGQTFVGGGTGRDTTWTLAESPYIVTRTFELVDGAVLTIEPGVEVFFERDQWLDATRGMLIADGLGGGTIVFRSADGEVGSWPGIQTGRFVPLIVTPEGEYVSGQSSATCASPRQPRRWRRSLSRCTSRTS